MAKKQYSKLMLSNSITSIIVVILVVLLIIYVITRLGNRWSLEKALMSGRLPAWRSNPSPPTNEPTKSPFIGGHYTDPNHPGGKREVILTPGAYVGGAYKLGICRGGGGKGEPKTYDLPCAIIDREDNSTIIMDFSAPPKNAPCCQDFVGIWDAQKNGIQWLPDGNFYPKGK